MIDTLAHAGRRRIRGRWTLRALAAATLLATGAGAAVADRLPSTPADYLARMDLDGDGRISLSEYRDYMSRGFRSMDVDGDGVLEGAELPVPGGRPVRLQNHLAALAATFARQDRDGDGFLDARELAAPPR